MNETTEAYRERMTRQGLEAARKLREDAQRNSGTVIPEARWAQFMTDYGDLSYSDLEERKDGLEAALGRSFPGKNEYRMCQRLGALTALLDDRYDPTPAYTKYPEPNGRPGSW